MDTKKDGRPAVIVDDDLAEGVYAASGSAPNHAQVSINNQTTAGSQGEWWNTLSWSLDGAHADGGMKLVLAYDRAVRYKDTGTPFIRLESGDGSGVLYLDVALGSKYASVRGATVTVLCDEAPKLLSASASCYGCAG